MPVQDTTNKLHAKLALIIKAHKKKLFRNHRNGMDIYEAVSEFVEKINQDLVCAIPDDLEPVDRADALKTIDTVTKEDRCYICGAPAATVHAGHPICSTCEEARNEKRALKEARVVADLLNDGGCPQFIFEAVLSVISDAFKHHGLRDPSPDDDYDERNLYPLFLETKLDSWGDHWRNSERLAMAINHILTLEETPVDLFNAVADWVCKASSGDIRELWNVKMLEHLLDFNKRKEEEEHDDDQKEEKSNAANV